MVKWKTQVLAVLLELNFMEGHIPACLGPGLGWGYGGAMVGLWWGKGQSKSLEIFICMPKLREPW